MAEVETRDSSVPSGVNPTLIASIAALGGLLFGYDTGVMSGVLLFVGPEFGMSAAQEGWVTSMLLVGAAVGALTGARIADLIGRRLSLIAGGAVFVFGSLWCAFADSVPSLAAARSVLGLAVGLVSVVVPMYIAELAPPQVRGRLVSLNTLMIVVGQLLAYGANSLLAPWGWWRLMLGLAVVPAVLLIVGMFFLPESPRVEKSSTRSGESVRIKPLALLGRVRWVRQAVIVAAALGVIQQITGVNAVVYFAPRLMQDAGLSTVNAVYTSILIGSVSVVACFVGLRVIDRVGRRPLLIGGLLVNALALSVLALSYGRAEEANAWTFVSLGSMTLFIASQQAAVSPTTWVLISELVPEHVRGWGLGLAGVALWSANWTVAQFFLPLAESVGAAAVFAGFALLGVVALAYVHVRVPETRGVGLSQVGEQFKSRYGN